MYWMLLKNSKHCRRDTVCNGLVHTDDWADPNKEAIALLGGSSILLDLLSHDDIEIQREAVRLLRSISVNGKEHKVTVLNNPERAQERLSSDRAVPVLLHLLNSTDDFSLNLGATAVLWNLSVNGKALVTHSQC